MCTSFPVHSRNSGLYATSVSKTRNGVTKPRTKISKVHQTYASAKIMIEGDRYMIGEYKTVGATVTTCDCESQNAK